MHNTRKMGGFAAAFCALATVLVSGSASAGVKYTGSVYASSTGRYAGGGLGYARNTSNGTEYIGCSVSQYSGSVSIYCSAQDSAGNYAGCTSTDAAFVAAARSLSTDEYMSFSYNASGTCTSLYVEHYSWNQPKVL